MHVKEKMLLNWGGLQQHGPINIVVFGDSVSHGAVDGYNDYENVYWNLLKKKLNAYRDFMPVNVINAGIGGTTAKESLDRMERDVLSHHPDLIIVCFGLNDVNGSLEDYINSLQQIFDRCLAAGCDTIFMTPNMLNTYVHDDVTPQYKEYAAKTAEMQNGGRMDQYIYAAKDLAEQMGIAVCDCYSSWKELSKTEDITALLANKINHPVSEMHHLFADALYGMIMQEECKNVSSDSTMFVDVRSNNA